jgi:hypothetical protein
VRRAALVELYPDRLGRIDHQRRAQNCVRYLPPRF